MCGSTTDLSATPLPRLVPVGEFFGGFFGGFFGIFWWFFGLFLGSIWMVF